ncbi:MAG TPA: ABC transporter ATP-binding protein [Stellaceae bacterium]|jgi:branched-chain amino acid transport system ATP-binding protein|nr:ABC transporter ATP-binding protein [Stellaceae bacterium]
MTEPLLRVDHVTKRFGGFVALYNVSLDVAEGERLGVIGPNGAGKSTLTNCVTGLLRPDSGRVWFAGGDVTALPAHRRARLGIARSFQLPRPFRSMNLIQNLAIPRDYAARGEPPDLRAVLGQVGLGSKLRVLPSALTQIELRKLELARALAGRPRLVICDEVMAGLSHAEVDEMLVLLFKLNADGITILMIEHIMRAVMRFSQRIVVLDAGRKIADGAPPEILRDKEVERAYLGA